MIRGITPYTGTHPDKATQDKDVFAQNIYNTHLYYDNTMVDDINNTIGDINAEAEVINTKLELVDYKGNYNSGTTYAQGESVTFNEIDYYSKTNSNLNHQPDTSPTYWREASVSAIADALDVAFDNTDTGMTATNAQDALVELSQSSGGTYDFVASGNLPDGTAVVLNNDGTVSIVEDTVAGAGIIASQDLTLSTFWYPTSVFNPNTSQVLVYGLQASAGIAYVYIGNVTATNISFASPIQIATSVTSANIYFDVDTTNNKILMHYSSGINYYFIAGQISGNTITLGSPISAGTTGSSDYYRTICWLTSDTYIVMNANNYRVITLSGTVVSLGTLTTHSITMSDFPVVLRYSSTHIVFRYRSSTAYYLRAASLSGSTLTFGTAHTLVASNIVNDSNPIKILPNGIILTGYKNSVDLKFYPITRELSGLTIAILSSGAGIVLGTGSVFILEAISNTQAIITYAGASSYLTMNTITIASNVPTINNDATIISSYTGSSTYYAVSADVANSHYTFFYPNSSTIVKGGILALSSVTTNVLDTIGVTESSALDTETVTVTIKGGINKSQSGLTIGSTYYVDYNGNITTTPTGTNVLLGRAISTTELQIKGA